MRQNKVEEEVQYTSYDIERLDTDCLTGIPSRLSFEKTMDNLIHQTGRKLKGYVLFIDIDDFKVINQIFGYSVGDSLIMSMAQYLQFTLSPFYEVFRINGDTFALVCGELIPDRLTKDMKKILRRCRSPWEIGDRTVFCTVSIAAVPYFSNGGEVEEIYRNLNDTLFQARKEGKNHFIIYSEDIEHVGDAVIRRRELEDLLWKAVDENFQGFQLDYQPIVCCKTGQIWGAEALLRFTTREGQRIPPLSFIPLAEQNGLILPIGEYVLNTAVNFCKTMINMGYKDFHISINISVRQLESPCFVKRFFDTIHKAEVPCQNIIIEITESMAASNMEQIQSSCKTLMDAGVHIALDDFGTGYSSLNMLQTMPFDGIKIDRSFIKDMLFEKYAESFIRLIADIKDTLGAVMYAEGVEEPEQLSRCRRLGINFIQGYIYYKAMSGQQLLQIMEEDKKQKKGKHSEKVV